MNPSSPWYLLVSPPADAARNMALDHALLATAAGRGRPVLRFYSWTEPAASFGYFQSHAALAALTPLRPLVRRPTGGGLVPHLADWTYSVTAPPGSDWYALRATASYERVHDWVRQAFLRLGVAAELAPCCRPEAPGQCFVGYEKSDVLWHDRKIAGAAQRRTKDGLLIQGSVQPPPLPLARAAWEAAMGAVGADGAGIAWTDFPADAAFLARADALETACYRQSAYHQRR